jgi:uncharacterized protein (TIGR03437 family)
MLATVTGDTTAGYTANISVGATFQVAAAAAPTITSGGVANAVSGAAGIAPASWVSIYGSNFATTSRALATSDLVANTIPTSLAGVSVQINSKPAFVQYVSPNQLNVLAPADTSQGQVAVTVTNAAGTSNSVTANLQTILPGLSVLSNYVRAVRYPDGAIVNGTGAAETGYTVSAAVGQGGIVALYGTGFGPTNSQVATGVVFTGAYPTNNAVAVSVGGISAEVLWAGLVGPGLYQINIRIPASLADGDHAVVATVAALSTQSTALIKVAASAKLAAQSAIAHLVRRLLGKDASAPVFVPAPLRSKGRLEQVLWLGGLAELEQYARAACVARPESEECADAKMELKQLA